MKLTMQKSVSWLLLVVMAFGLSFDADAQKEKKKKKGKKNKTEQVVPKKNPTRIINSDRSEVCEVFSNGAEPTDADLARISQNFADMNLRRQVKDYGPGEYSAHYYWQKMYEEAPGFSILVYTDGSQIFREIAAVAKEEEDEAKFQENIQKAFDLIEEGEKCYPETKGKFGPSKAYLKELSDPSAYEEILSLYTEGFSNETDPYTLGSIVRYSQYMGYINKITKAEADQWLQKCKAVAALYPEDRDYKFAAEEIASFETMYNEAYAEKEAQEKAAEEAKNNQSTGGAQSGGGNALYEEMMTAFDGGNLSVASSKFNEYIATVDDPTSRYQTAMFAGGSFYNANDYPKARSAYQKAAAADPSQGDPYYYIGLMYLSSGPLCGEGTGFDSQRVMWASFEKFDIAKSKSLTGGNAADIDKLVREYKGYLPAQYQLDEKGLKVGDTYTVPCWINEVVTVTSKEKPGR